MTLTAFLLARLDEDEVGLGGFGPSLLEQAPDGSSTGRRVVSARVLAECEAKRRIVEEIDGTRATATYTTRLLTILLYLALPYADHPDYREEWRP